MDLGLKGLLELRVLDDKIVRNRKKLEVKPARLRTHQREVETAELELQRVQDEMQKLQAVVDRRNVELKAAEESVQKLSGQLMALKTNEEYSAMQKQIATKQGVISEIEDLVLEDMEVVEQAKTELPPRQARLKEEQVRLSEEEQTVAREVEELGVELAELEKAFEEKSATVPEEPLARYMGARAQYSATALMEVTDAGICQGCYTKVTSNVLNTAVGGHVAQCTSCHRLLFCS